jgi:hypothetical protein
MTLGLGVSRKAVRGHSLHGPDGVVAIGPTVKERPPRDGNATFSAERAGEDLK